jgi:NADH-quinone oxidoreductase subunit N
MFLFQATNPDVNLSLIAPELIVSIAGVVIMLVDAFSRRRQRWVTGSLSLIALAAAGAASIWLWTSWPAQRTAFNGMIVLDELRLSFTLIFLLVSFLTILISSVWIENENLPAGEFHSLLLFATSGMMLMASAGDLVIVFLGLEILSIATYVLAGFRRTDMRSNESSLKYFILGSFASAFLLYGIALVYGGTATGPDSPGTTNIALIAARASQSLYPPLLLAGAAMMLVGFGFKIATAPFHVWTPDVYEGAPTPVTAFMAAGPKAAGFASFLRVFVFGFPIATAVVSAGGHAHQAWLGALTIMAVLTMTVGQRLRDRSEQCKANARLLVDSACRLCAGGIRRGRGRNHAGRQKRGSVSGGLLSADLCGDEHGRLCRGDLDRASRRSTDQR